MLPSPPIRERQRRGWRREGIGLDIIEAADECFWKGIFEVLCAPKHRHGPVSLVVIVGTFALAFVDREPYAMLT